MALLYLEPLPPRVTKSALLFFIQEQGGADLQRVGRLELLGRQARLEIPEGWATRLTVALDGALFQKQRLHAWVTTVAEASPDGDEHFQRLGELLELESQAEAERALERNRGRTAEQAEQSGETLLRLSVADHEAGLGGRFLIQLVKPHRARLPWTRLGVGSPVYLSPEGTNGRSGVRGVVCQREERALWVALNDLPDALHEATTWRVDLSYDEVAVQRQRVALRCAQHARGDRLSELRAVLVGHRAPSFAPVVAEAPLNPALNAVQQEAVNHALAAADVALIHGPPGTGKTTAVVELIRPAVRRGDKVLACAPSNLAVDNLLERLLAFGERAVRLGHPARVLPELRQHTLDLLVEEHPDVRLSHRLIKEAQGLFRQADRPRRARVDRNARRDTRNEARQLLADARRLEAQAIEHILDTADILCVTTTGIDHDILGPRRFDLAVIDEASQSTEPGCWIPLLRSHRVVLAGDHCQLPPTILSDEAASGGFGISLFERLMALHGRQIARRLAVQYRMHESIMAFPSAEFYEGQLQADPSVAHHSLSDLPELAGALLNFSPVEFVDTAGAGYDEEQEADGESRLNRGEAELVCRRARALLEAGLAASDLAIIAPYAAQVRWLRQQLAIPGLEIDSVDGFQGREKEVVLISLVRSNPTGEIGFLGDVRRTNVAMTRARRKLLVVGDSATLAGHPFYHRMLDYFEQSGAYRTVWEESE